MQLAQNKINVDNSTLNTLIKEFKEECYDVLSLINQLELSDLSENQRGTILAELLRKGVPKKDVVLAFHDPQSRKYTDFAIA